MTESVLIADDDPPIRAGPHPRDRSGGGCDDPQRTVSDG